MHLGYEPFDLRHRDSPEEGIDVVVALDFIRSHLVQVSSHFGIGTSHSRTPRLQNTCYAASVQFPHANTTTSGPGHAGKKAFKEVGAVRCGSLNRRLASIGDCGPGLAHGTRAEEHQDDVCFGHRVDCCIMITRKEIL